MRKIVFLDADTIGADIDMSPISCLGEYTSYPYTKPEEVFERIQDCDVLIVNKVIM